MSKLKIAREIARKTGSTTSDALRYVSRVGEDTARASLRSARSGSLKVPAVVGAGGGGFLYYREQNIEQNRIDAEKTDSEAEKKRLDLELLKLAIENDLDPSKLGIGDDDESDDDDDDDPKRFPFDWPDEFPGLGDISETLDDALDETTKMVLAIVIVAIVVQYILNRSAMPSSPAVYGGGR